MRKISFLLVLLLLCFAAITIYSCSDKNIDITVVGAIEHGPMQPTVNSINDVFSNYNNRIIVHWLSFDSAEGQQFMKKNGLTAHLNILINGKYRYHINGKEVVFQWFEGQSWTREDLDSVIRDLLQNKKIK